MRIYQSFLQTFGFTAKELNNILDELNTSRTIWAPLYLNSTDGT
jgi:hypothetical protein